MLAPEASANILRDAEIGFYGEGLMYVNAL